MIRSCHAGGPVSSRVSRRFPGGCCTARASCRGCCGACR
jgi:hypothetical protein